MLCNADQSAMGIRQVFAANLRRRRAAAGLSQEALAAAADLDRTYISSLERCVYGASIDAVAKIAAALGVEAADLLIDAGSPSRRAPHTAES